MFVLKTIWHRIFKYKGLKWGFRWKRYSKLFLWKILVFVEITWILRIRSYWFNKLRKKTHIFFDMIWIHMNSIFGENSSFLLKKKQEFWELCLIYTILDFGVTSHNVIDQSMIINFEMKKIFGGEAKQNPWDST